MKIRGTKPTREERKWLVKNDLDTYIWLVKRNTPTEIVFIHSQTCELKTINKD